MAMMMCGQSRSGARVVTGAASSCSDMPAIVVESRNFSATYNRRMWPQTTDVPISPVRRVLGLDVGSKRIGIAISDLLGITAQGLETLQRQNKRLDFEKLAKLVRDSE